MPTTTLNYGFTKPDIGQPNWGATFNATLDTIDSVIAALTGGAVNTVTFSGTPTLNLNLGSVQMMTLTGNVTSSSVSNAKPGVLTIVLLQDGTGGHTFTFPSNFRGVGSVSAAAGTASANSYCSQSFVYVPASNIFVAITPLLYGE